jgi:hypothetical protein
LLKEITCKEKLLNLTLWWNILDILGKIGYAGTNCSTIVERRYVTQQRIKKCIIIKEIYKKHNTPCCILAMRGKVFWIYFL